VHSGPESFFRARSWSGQSSGGDDFLRISRQERGRLARPLLSRHPIRTCIFSAKQQANVIFHGPRKTTGWFLLVLVLAVRAGRPRSQVLAENG
jgi:hypothetical protein